MVEDINAIKLVWLAFVDEGNFVLEFFMVNYNERNSNTLSNARKLHLPIDFIRTRIHVIRICYGIKKGVR